MTIPDPIKRALRTFIQAAIGVFLPIITAPQIAPNEVPHYSVLRSAAIAAIWAGCVAVVTLVQNSLETAGVIPTLGRAPTPVVVPAAALVTTAAPVKKVPVKKAAKKQAGQSGLYVLLVVVLVIVVLKLVGAF